MALQCARHPQMHPTYQATGCTQESMSCCTNDRGMTVECTLFLCVVQMTAQDVSSMMRWGAAPIIFLINNAGYAIEIEIHDGPYNQ